RSDALRCADHVDVSRRQHLNDALIEAEITHRVRDLSVLDQPDAVTREARPRGRPRIDASNVPKAADQQRARRAFDHVLDARSRSARLDDGVDRPRRGLPLLLRRRDPRVLEGLEHAVANEMNGLSGNTIVCILRSGKLGAPRIAHDADALVEHALAKASRSAWS